MLVDQMGRQMAEEAAVEARSLFSTTRSRQTQERSPQPQVQARRLEGSSPVVAAQQSEETAVRGTERMEEVEQADTRLSHKIPSLPNHEPRIRSRHPSRNAR